MPTSIKCPAENKMLKFYSASSVKRTEWEKQLAQILKLPNKEVLIKIDSEVVRQSFKNADFNYSP